MTLGLKNFLQGCQFNTPSLDIKLGSRNYVAFIPNYLDTQVHFRDVSTEHKHVEM